MSRETIHGEIQLDNDELKEAEKIWNKYRNASDLEIAKNLDEEGIDYLLAYYSYSLKPSIPSKHARNEKVRSRRKSIMAHRENLLRRP